MLVTKKIASIENRYTHKYKTWKDEEERKKKAVLTRSYILGRRASLFWGAASVSLFSAVFIVRHIVTLCLWTAHHHAGFG